MKRSFAVFLMLALILKVGAQCGTPFFRAAGTLLLDVAVLNDKVAVAVGDNGYIIKSVDAGNSWKNVPKVSSYYLKAVHFPSSRIGYSAGYGVILKTEDSGESWFPLAFTLRNNYLP